MNLDLDLSILDKAFKNVKVVRVENSDEKKGGGKHLRIGFHTSKGDHSGIIPALEEDYQLLSKYFKKTCAQIFTQVPQTTNFIKMEEPNKIVDFAKSKDMKLVIHSPYAMNDFWTTKNEGKLVTSLANANELMYGKDGMLDHHLAGLVIHLPKKSPAHVTEVINKRSNDEVCILLENHAYKPDDCSYELPSKLNKLTEMLIASGLKNWGYCIDTAHLFVQISKGDRLLGYKIETKAGMTKWMNELSPETKKRIKCWHLNGSMNPASSYDDKHAIPVFGLNHLLQPIPNPTGKAKPEQLEKGYCKDYMWGDLLMKAELAQYGIESTISDQVEALSDSSLVTVLQHAIEHDIPVVLEINRGNPDDINSCLAVFQRLESDIISGNI